MKFIICLASLLALASAAVISPGADSEKLGLIRVPQATLLKEAKAQLRIYVIVPRSGEKLKLPINSAQLSKASYVEVSQNTSAITTNPQFPHTGLGPSNDFFSLSSNVVVEIWDEQVVEKFVGGSILTLKQIAQNPIQTLALQDSTGLFTGTANVVYKN
ncbi:hypothetical protein TYRP_011934 [Tyrophagus putrescentiae]|nr:hypothetical protein TYRP_011934 [Tyrophagus putrescentiae]